MKSPDKKGQRGAPYKGFSNFCKTVAVAAAELAMGTTADSATADLSLQDQMPGRGDAG